MQKIQEHGRKSNTLLPVRFDTSQAGGQGLMQRFLCNGCQQRKLGLMKYFVGTICAAAILTFCSSCKKNAATNDSSGSLIGTWELRHAQNGMMPNIDYPNGNGNILVFSGSGYEKYTNGTLVKSGSYIMVRDDSAQASVGLVITPGQFTNRIIFDNDLVSPKTFVEVSHNSFTLLSGYFPLDGGSDLVYERVEDKH